MIIFTNGDIFKSNCDALTNPVNCKGVMGKGLALEFKNRYPANFKAYQSACNDGVCAIGKVFIMKTGGKYIINLPTKDDWRNKSELVYVKSGLYNLKAQLPKYDIKSIAMPRVGCGLGGLDWKDVKPLIVECFDNTQWEIVIFE